MKDKLIESWDIAKEVAFEGKEGNYYNFVVVRLFFLQSGGTSVNVDHEGEYFFSTDEPEENDEVRTKLVTDLFVANPKDLQEIAGDSCEVEPQREVQARLLRPWLQVVLGGVP